MWVSFIDSSSFQESKWEVQVSALKAHWKSLEHNKYCKPMEVAVSESVCKSCKNCNRNRYQVYIQLNTTLSLHEFIHEHEHETSSSTAAAAAARRDKNCNKRSYALIISYLKPIIELRRFKFTIKYRYVWDNQFYFNYFSSKT